MIFGEYIQTQSTIPAGGDEYIAHQVISALPDKHWLLTQSICMGGDANEVASLWMIPNMNLAPNTEPKAGDISGAIQVCSTGFFNCTNALGNTDANNRATAFAADSGRGLGMQPILFVLPANYTLVATSFTANTAVLNWSAGGFVVEG